MATEPLLFALDFNIHVNVPSDYDAMKFLDLLQSSGLVQHVNFPTHVSATHWTCLLLAKVILFCVPYLDRATIFQIIALLYLI